MPLREATQYVLPDEPAFYMRQIVAPPRPPETGDYRVYQIIGVVRDVGPWVQTEQKIVEYWEDIGPASAWQGRHLLNVLAGDVDDRGRGISFHSVTELQEMSLQDRERPVEDLTPTQDFETGYHDEMDKRKWAEAQ